MLLYNLTLHDVGLRVVSENEHLEEQINIILVKMSDMNCVEICIKLINSISEIRVIRVKQSAVRNCFECKNNDVVASAKKCFTLTRSLNEL